jgi:hypothetical protein
LEGTRKERVNYNMNQREKKKKEPEEVGKMNELLGF